MRDVECVAFLQWALPRLGLRWPGYRKVRAQVCKRVHRHLAMLGLDGIVAYRRYLEDHPGEWRELDRLCPITISRFYRDKDVFDFIAAALLPQLAREASARGHDRLAVWSAGCASGEEPCGVALAWHCQAGAVSPPLALRVLATDIEPAVLERARAGCYAASCLKLLPPVWLTLAFEKRDGRYCVRPQYQAGIEFRQEDIRQAAPAETFDLILCRNLVFTYFDEAGQRSALVRLLQRLHPGGALVIGRRERLPPGEVALEPWPGAERLGIYRYRAASRVER
jgi:chemotaxis protein methyltransferase CheR